MDILIIGIAVVATLYIAYLLYDLYTGIPVLAQLIVRGLQADEHPHIDINEAAATSEEMYECYTCDWWDPDTNECAVSEEDMAILCPMEGEDDNV